MEKKCSVVDKQAPIFEREKKSTSNTKWSCYWLPYRGICPPWWAGCKESFSRLQTPSGGSFALDCQRCPDRQMARLGFGTRTSRTGLPEPDWYRPPLMYLAIVHLKRTKWCSEEWNMYELSRLLGFVFLPTKVWKVQRKRFDWSGQPIKKCCTSQKTIAVFCYIVETQSSWDLRYTSSTFRFSRKVSRISEERSYAVCAVKFWENTFLMEVGYIL